MYEWKKLKGRKQPYYIRLQDGQPFAFAGLWERWNRGDSPIDSCTILTTDANELVGSIHDPGGGTWDAARPKFRLADSLS